MTRYRRTWNRVIGLALMCTLVSTTFLALVILGARQTARVSGDVYLCQGSEARCEMLVRARHVLWVPLHWISGHER